MSCSIKVWQQLWVQSLNQSGRIQSFADVCGMPRRDTFFLPETDEMWAWSCARNVQVRFASVDLSVCPSKGSSNQSRNRNRTLDLSRKWFSQRERNNVRRRNCSVKFLAVFIAKSKSSFSSTIFDEGMSCSKSALATEINAHAWWWPIFYRNRAVCTYCWKNSAKIEPMMTMKFLIEELGPFCAVFLWTALICPPTICSEL